MMCIHKLALLLSVLGIVQGWEVYMDIDTAGYPQVYENEMIQIRCIPTEFVEVIKLYIGSIHQPPVACKYNSASDLPEPVIPPWTPHPPLNPACLRLTLAASFNVSKIARGTRIYCQAQNSTFDKSKKESHHFQMPMKKHLPQDLRMILRSETMEGKKFTFSCESTGGRPQSEFKYEVLRKDKVVANSSQYTPVVEDRNGFTIKCTDRVHYGIFDRYPALVVKKMDLKPRYKKNKNNVVTWDVTVDHKLDCNENGYPDGTTYEWSKNPDRTDHPHPFEALIPNRTRKAGDVENVTCTAFIEPDLFDTINWQITWSNKQPNNTLITTMVCVGAFIAGIIGVAVIVWKKKKNAGPNNGYEVPEERQELLRRVAAEVAEVAVGAAPEELAGAAPGVRAEANAGAAPGERAGRAPGAAARRAPGTKAKAKAGAAPGPRAGAGLGAATGSAPGTGAKAKAGAAPVASAGAGPGAAAERAPDTGAKEKAGAAPAAMDGAGTGAGAGAARGAGRCGPKGKKEDVNANNKREIDCTNLYNYTTKGTNK